MAPVKSQWLIELGPRPLMLSTGMLAGLLALVPSPADGRASMQPDGLMQQNGTYVPPAVNRMPTTLDQNQMRQQQSDDTRIEAANAERKKEISTESERLLKMATDLKQDLDKTDKDTLSLSTIRKIDAIQKLVKDMKDKLRLRSN